MNDAVHTYPLCFSQEGKTNFFPSAPTLWSIGQFLDLGKKKSLRSERAKRGLLPLHAHWRTAGHGHWLCLLPQTGGHAEKVPVDWEKQDEEQNSLVLGLNMRKG
jgi:hypothetical protein